jgi:diguanylate cyclase (GGDEF)-like protein
MQEAVGSRGTVVRLGGDEFAVLMPGASAESAEVIAASIRGSFTEPFKLSPGMIQGGGSVGWAAAGPGQPAEEVVAAADKAMYDAKPRDRRGMDRSGSAPDRGTGNQAANDAMAVPVSH